MSATPHIYVTFIMGFALQVVLVLTYFGSGLNGMSENSVELACVVGKAVQEEMKMELINLSANICPQ